MWSATCSITTQEITKAQIWELMSNINQWHKWDSTVEYARIEGDFAKGQNFILKPKGGFKVKIKIIECIPLQKFVDLTLFPLAKMYGEHTFEETEKGLKITVTMRVTGPLSFLWIKLVAKNIGENLHRDITNQIHNAKRILL